VQSDYPDGAERGVDRVKHLRSYGMNATEIQDIWQAIQESERSDESHFTSDETSVKTEASRVPHHLQDLFGDVGSEPGRKSIADATISPALPRLD
jgi:hypothetical protein